jgi:hypothetical protein
MLMIVVAPGHALHVHYCQHEGSCARSSANRTEMTALIVLCLKELSIENAKTLITLSVKHDDSEAPAVRKIT